MLKKLHDAAKAVLSLRDGQHSLAEEIAAYEKLATAVEGAGDELRAEKRAAAKAKKSASSTSSTKKA